MYDYHFARLSLRSTLELPELCEIAPGAPTTNCDVVITLDSAGLHPDFVPTLVDDRSSFELMAGPVDGELILRHEGAIDFTLSADLSHITIRRTDDVAESTVRHYLLDQVLPRLVEGRGSFVLHASGVETPDGGIMFLGDSGTGKSSLAAEFARVGHRLLGDDCFAIDESPPVSAVSTYPSLRLLPDAIDHMFGSAEIGLSEVAENRPKQRVAQSRLVPPEPGNISCLFVIDVDLEYIGPPSLQQVSGRNALLYLLKNSFRLNVTGEGALRSLTSAENILKQVTLYELRYERSYDQLSHVRETIMQVPELR